MPGFLGCAEHRVVVTHRGGTPVVGALDGVVSLTYSRVLDDTSEAVVDVEGCCGVLGELRTWGHELHVLRDGTAVWCGPVTEIVVRSDSATIVARDVTAWLDVRTVHSLIDTTADLTTIALAVISDAFSVDDPNVLPYVVSSPSNITGTRRIEPGRSTAGDELRELARTGVDFTAVGRRIVVDGEQIDTPPLATLLPDAFLSDVEVVERGDLAATRWVVNGAGVSGQASVTDAFYGVVERVVDEDSIRDAASAGVAAQTRLAATYPAPLFVVVPDGAQLAPHAPVAFNELVPGALVRITLPDLCRPVTQTMRLQRVDVSDTADAPDVVAVTFAPVGTVASAATAGEGTEP